MALKSINFLTLTQQLKVDRKFNELFNQLKFKVVNHSPMYIALYAITSKNPLDRLWYLQPFL
jgi:hypothetical protein